MANKPTQKKASLATDAVLGQGAASLTKAVTEIKNAFQAIAGLEQQAEELSLQVASRTEQIEALTLDFQERERQAALDLDLKLKSNAERVVNEELTKTGKIAVKRDDYNAISTELTTIKNDLEKTVTAAEGKAVAMAKAKFEGEKSLLEANFKAQEASNIATISSLQEKVTFLETQLGKWEAALDAERKAGVERAKASAVGSVNVTNAK
jgi:hypothetical protein